jgi:hypothetical protein
MILLNVRCERVFREKAARKLYKEKEKFSTAKKKDCQNLEQKLSDGSIPECCG